MLKLKISDNSFYNKRKTLTSEKGCDFDLIFQLINVMDIKYPNLKKMLHAHQINQPLLVLIAEKIMLRLALCSWTQCSPRETKA